MTISSELYRNAPHALTAAERKLVLIERIKNDFTYHMPQGDQAQRYQQLREKAKEFALLIADLTPESPEQSEAFTLLNLSCMSANAAIARHE